MNSKELTEQLLDDSSVLQDRIAAGHPITGYYIVVNFDGKPSHFAYGASKDSWLKLDSMIGLLHQVLKNKLIDQMVEQSDDAVQSLLDEIQKNNNQSLN